MCRFIKVPTGTKGKKMRQEKDIMIVGIALRTSNDEAMETIPPLWGQFYAEGILEKIKDKVSSDVYAVYTNFENEGVSNEGQYTLIIGAEVESFEDVPEGLATTTIKAQNRVVFAVKEGKPENVGATWHEVWGQVKLEKTFIAEYEHYHDRGIDIYIGVK